MVQSMCGEEINILSLKIPIEGEFSKIPHKPPILNFAKESKINNGDDKTHQLANRFYFLAFRTYTHSNKEMEKIIIVNARVMATISSANEKQ